MMPLKSVLSAKLLEAQNKGIDITVEVEEPIDDFQIGILDFITIYPFSVIMRLKLVRKLNTLNFL